MIDYDSFSRCHLTDIFFRFSRGSKRVKPIWLLNSIKLILLCCYDLNCEKNSYRLLSLKFKNLEAEDHTGLVTEKLTRCFFYTDVTGKSQGPSN